MSRDHAPFPPFPPGAYEALLILPYPGAGYNLATMGAGWDGTRFHIRAFRGTDTFSITSEMEGGREPEEPSCLLAFYTPDDPEGMALLVHHALTGWGDGKADIPSDSPDPLEALQPEPPYLAECLLASRREEEIDDRFGKTRAAVLTLTPERWHRGTFAAIPDTPGQRYLPALPAVQGKEGPSILRAAVHATRARVLLMEYGRRERAEKERRRAINMLDGISGGRSVEKAVGEIEMFLRSLPWRCHLS
ncbi:MAG: hypothetical protein J7L61_04615 [Thermoplasmata archaeon]|nr:hypothetical protein [Thermoplasmata archaeon]